MADEGKKSTHMKDIVKDASLLSDKRKELDDLRSDDKREWALNKEFYKGNQWSFWNKQSSKVESLGVDDGDKPRYKVRLTSNQILPGVQELVAQMTKTRPTIRATPDSGADRDIKAAQLAERLYEYWWAEFGLASKLKSALTHAQLSAGYWMISWDALAGKSMKITLNPEDGSPITDDLIADAFREELQKMGIPVEEFEKVLYMGDISVQVLGGEQVWLDPTGQNFEDAKYAICKFPMDVDEVKARYGKKVEPDSSTGDAKPSLAHTSVEGRPKNVRDVYMMYHRPSPSLPKGAYVVWIEEPYEILYESEWRFPFMELPLVKFPGMERPGSMSDEPRVSSARSLNKELNNTISKIAMHKNLTMRPQMIAPVGSLRQRLTDEPGAVFEYSPVQGLAPEWRPIPGLPSYLQWYLEFVQGRIDRIFNRIPTERSQLPARTDSGQLVELVQEAVADQIAPEIHRMEDALARAGDLMAHLAQTYYEEQRLLKIKGPGGSVQVKKFLNADLEGGFSFSPEAGSGLPRTRAGQVAQIKEMVEMGVLPPDEALNYLPIAGLKGIQARLESDEDFAHRKIEKLMRGEPLNVPAAMQAIQAVQSGTNPETQEMFQSEEEAQAFVEQASLTPQSFENLGVTAGVFALHMKSVEFERYEPPMMQKFVQHFEMIQQMMSQGEAPEDSVKTTLSLKGTLGPTTAAEILQQKGIQSATPETMAEPPLETSVYDSVDKTDMDDAGNDPFTEQEQAMAAGREEEKHMLATAKSMNQLSHAESESARGQATAERDHDREEDDRQTKRERDEELHQEKLKAMRRPKPSATKK